MPTKKPMPPISVRLLGTKDTVARLVVALREVLDITYATQTYEADPPYEVRRFLGASGLREAGLPVIVADIRATAKSWSRGNLAAEAAMERIQDMLGRNTEPPPSAGGGERRSTPGG